MRLKFPLPHRRAAIAEYAHKNSPDYGDGSLEDVELVIRVGPALSGEDQRVLSSGSPASNWASCLYKPKALPWNKSKMNC
jgi:hypothetical protein